MEALHTVDAEQVGANPVYEGAHTVEHLAQLLQVGFAGGVVNGGGALCEDCRHYDIGRTGDGGLVQEHIAPGKAAVGGKVEGPAGGVVLHIGPELYHTVQVGVYPAAAYLVSSGFGEPGVAEAGEQRSHDHHGAAQLGAVLHEFLGLDIAGVHFIGLEGIYSLGLTGYLYAHLLKQFDEVFHVQDFRDIAYGYLFAGKKHCAYHLQGLVLGPLRCNGSGQLVPAFNDKFCHRHKYNKFSAKLLDYGHNVLSLRR